MTDRDQPSREEEAKRDRHTPPAERWRLIAETTAWADVQQSVARNTKAYCLDHQRRLLRSSDPGGTKVGTY